MKITVQNKTYYIEFLYEVLSPGKLFTTCKILDEQNQVVTSAVAEKTTRDVHVKEIARKVSLTYALKIFPKDFRKEVWKEYFNRKSPPKSFSVDQVKQILETIEDCHNIGDVRNAILIIKQSYNIQTIL